MQLISFYKVGVETWYAAVLPAASSLKSVVLSSDNRDVLVYAESTANRESLFKALITKIERMIGELHSGAVGFGHFSVDKSRLPPESHYANPPPVKPAPEHPSTSSAPPPTVIAEVNPKMEELRNILERIESELKGVKKTLQVKGQLSDDIPTITPGQPSHGSLRRKELVQQSERVLESRALMETWRPLETTRPADEYSPRSGAAAPVGVKDMRHDSRLYLPPVKYPTLIRCLLPT